MEKDGLVSLKKKQSGTHWDKARALSFCELIKNSGLSSVMTWLNILKVYKKRHGKIKYEMSRKCKSNVSKALKTGISVITTDAVSQLCHEIVFGHYGWVRKQSVTILSAF